MKKYSVLLLIVLAAFSLRFYNFFNRYGIGYDGSRDALVAFESARQIQLPLTGSFSSIGPITFGPLYYWYITFATYLIPSSWAPWMAIGLASVGMVLMMYLIGRRLQGEILGLILAFIAALSPAQILSAAQLQQHALIGFLSSVVVYFSIRQVQDGLSFGLSILWGFAMGFAVNSHYQAAGLFTLPILAIFFSRRRRTFIFPFITGVFISIIPILIFELTNHWFNTRNILDYIFIAQYRVWTSNRWLTFAGKFIPEFWGYVLGVPAVMAASLMVATGFLFFAKALNRRISREFLILLLSFAAMIVMLRYYRGEKFFGYLQFLHVYVFIFTGYIFYLIFCRLKRFSLFAIFLLAYIYIIYPSIGDATHVDAFNQETTARVNKLNSLYPGQKFSTYECKNVYDVHRNQGLLLLLYMNKQYDEEGRKIAISNPGCEYFDGKDLGNELVDMTESTKAATLEEGGLKPITPLAVWADTARWWFTEQP